MTASVEIGGLVRQGLAAGAGLQVGGLVREVLCSQTVVYGVVVGGLVREVLALYLPPSTAPGAEDYAVTVDASGPIPVLNVPPSTMPILPAPPPGFPVKVSLVLDTIVGTTKSLREMRAPQQIYPIFDIEILYEELKDQTQNESAYAPFSGYTQYQQVLQDWLFMYGQTGVFGFDCPWDNSRENQYFGTGDGVTWAFNVYYTFGQGAQALLLPVGMLNQVAAVYINGTEVDPSRYYVTRNKIVFQPTDAEPLPPASGATLTATFTFYYLCRFVADEQDTEEFAKNRWTIGSLKMRASPWLT